MKKKLLALLLVLACLCLSGCQLMEDIESAATDSVLALVAEKAEESGADVLTRQFVDGLLEDDPQKSHAVFVNGMELSQVLAVFPQMQELLPAASSYTLTPVHWRTNSSDGVTMLAFQFHLTLAEETFVVETLQMSGVDGLYNIHIAPMTEAADSGSADPSSPVFIILSILLTIASCAVTLWALVHCARHKMKHKWLWVLLVLFGSIMLTLTLSGSRLNFRFNIGLYLVASQIVPYSSGFAMKLVLPIGPIIYLVRRKALTAPPKAAFAEAFSDMPEAFDPQAIKAEPVQEESHEPEEV